MKLRNVFLLFVLLCVTTILRQALSQAQEHSVGERPLLARRSSSKPIKEKEREVFRDAEETFRKTSMQRLLFQLERLRYKLPAYDERSKMKKLFYSISSAAFDVSNSDRAAALRERFGTDLPRILSRINGLKKYKGHPVLFDLNEKKVEYVNAILVLQGKSPIYASQSGWVWMFGKTKDGRLKAFPIYDRKQRHEIVRRPHLVMKSIQALPNMDREKILTRIAANEPDHPKFKLNIKENIQKIIAKLFNSLHLEPR